MGYFDRDFLQFFRELAANNNREWFNAHKARYIQSVKTPFELFITDLIQAFKSIEDIGDLTAREAIFRIYRDIRFSKDKSPYKLHMAALIARNGRKGMHNRGMYIHISPEEFAIYSGLYQPTKEMVYKVRKRIAREPEVFLSTINHPAFQEVFGTIHGEKNKRIPSEFRETAGKLPILYNKEFYYFKKFPPEEIFRDDLVEFILNTYQAAKPLQDFLWKALEDENP